ncbi:MAG: hypothetical protein KZQ60_11680 [Candidatus Thiodiazotropha sp. (ex Lucinoma aequizonata)]|nr:hypothetical protein [Candidatus Thiodiazotropha sp. (ex Lucinoma aequizonata)]
MHFHSKLLLHYSIMTTAMTLRRLGCALCMPFISPFRSPFRPYNRAYAYRGLTAFAPLSMAVSVGVGALLLLIGYFPPLPPRDKLAVDEGV